MLQEMVLSDENSSRVGVKNTNIPGGEEMAVKNAGAEIRSKRRVLGSIINHDLVGTSQCVVKKRGGLKGTNVVSCKNKPFPLQRPITRPNSAQMGAALPQSCAEETKTLTKSSNEFRVWEDAPVTYVVEEQSETKNQPQPMLVEHPEIEMTEKTQMEEVEMEDIFEENIMDIDSSDAKNPLAATDYVEDMYFYFKEVESSSCVFPNYMINQEDINERMRSILIDWLIEVHHKFELREETLFLTVNLIDRFLERQSVVRKKLQLVGLVAMLLACKYEEVSVPVVDDLVFISDKAYKRTEVLEMESLILNTLQFNMSVPTPYVFMQRFLKAAQADRKLELVSFFFIELCLVEYEMLKYPPSFLAAAAIYTAQCALYGVGLWNKTCEWHSSYSEDQLLECSKMIVSFHQKAATGKLTGVHRKYNTSKFGYTARCEPAHHLVQTTTSHTIG